MKTALGCFEQDDRGVWVCVKDARVPAAIGGFTIPVVEGTEFSARTIFAGYPDFVAFLESVAVQDPAGPAEDAA